MMTDMLNGVHVLTALLVLLFSNVSESGIESARDLPARFVANRIYVEPSLANGKRLRFYTDSGGGINMLCRTAAQRIGLTLTPYADAEAERELGKNLALTRFPAFAQDRGIPFNVDGNDRLLVHDCAANPGWPNDAWGEGFLSSRWFEGRVWTWDYPRGRLRIETAGYVPDASAQKVPLGFKRDDSGKAVFAMARMSATVDHDVFDALLDTGATTLLSGAALAKAQNGLPALRATSFIVHSRFEQWHHDHPKWRVIDDAEIGTKARMIEVPEMEIAGARIGPVWFTERPDAAFHEWMAQMMDKPTDGAIGGNAFGHFIMTIDYPHATAYFRCVHGCRPTPRSAP